MNGFLECGVALLDDRCQNLLCGERRLGLTQLDRVLCRNARYGQDGALSGLHNGLVGGLRSPHHGPGKHSCIDQIRFLDLFCKPTEKL